MEGKTPREEALARKKNEQRERAAYTARLRSFADLLDKHPEVALPDGDLPMPETGPFVTASYLQQLTALSEFLDRTNVPLHRYGSVTVYWHADSIAEVDAIAAQAGMTPEWNKDRSGYGAVQSFGPNIEYKVACRDAALPKQASAPAAETSAAA